MREQHDNLNSLGQVSEREDIEQILRDPLSYMNGGIQKLKQLQAKLQGLIDAMLIGKRDHAKKIIDRLETEFRDTPDYNNLTEAQQQSFLREYEAERENIDRLGRVLTIENAVDTFTRSQVIRLNRQHQQAEANCKPEPHGDPGNPPDPDTPQPVYVSAAELRPRGQKGILDSEDDVETYMNALRSAYLDAVREGKKIRL